MKAIVSVRRKDGTAAKVLGIENPRQASASITMKLDGYHLPDMIVKEGEALVIEVEG